MTTERLLESPVLKDPSWSRALTVASQQLEVPGHIWGLFHGSWFGGTSPEDFFKIISISKLNLFPLVQAARIPISKDQGAAATVMQAISVLGVPMSAAVMAINFAGTSILRHRPPAIWREIFENMMASVEIGVKIGERIPELTAAGGAVLGFATGAGLGLLLAHDAHAFLQWHSLTGGVEGRELMLQFFGCEPYQVSACALQQLGFGPQIAIGAALATGSIKGTHLEFDKDELRWKAALLWIDALRSGRSYPADPSVRNFFPELTPALDGKPRNLTLETVYAEIARVKRDGSRWTWHLPRPTYEETLRSL